MFVGKIPETSVASWIIVLAIITGVLIMLLIIMALHKARILAKRNTSFRHRHLMLVSPYNYPLTFYFYVYAVHFYCLFLIIFTNKCAFYYLSIISVVFL